MRAFKVAHFALKACLILSAGIAVPACSPDAGTLAGNGNITISSGAGGTGGTGGVGGAPAGSSELVIILPDAGAFGGASGSGGSTGDASVGDGKPFHCDDAGNCTCLAILSLGQPGQTGSATGASGDTNAFQAYMNTNTNATMTVLKTFTPLTDSLLNQYDVVILQALQDQTGTARTWTFQASDIAALEKWVRAGGGIIAMSGYGLNSAEVNPLNQLLSFSGISYGTADTFARCPNNLCTCTDNSIPFNNWQTTYADNPAITHDLKQVGIYHGRPLKCAGTDCQVFATDPSAGGGNVGVAQVVGNGRILAWGDEWVTYTSQWGLTPTQWDSATTHPECANRTATSTYSVPQFWNNVFKWAAPAASCFTITQPTEPGQQIIY